MSDNLEQAAVTGSGPAPIVIDVVLRPDAEGGLGSGTGGGLGAGQGVGAPIPSTIGIGSAPATGEPGGPSILAPAGDIEGRAESRYWERLGVLPPASLTPPATAPGGADAAPGAPASTPALAMQTAPSAPPSNAGPIQVDGRGMLVHSPSTLERYNRIRSGELDPIEGVGNTPGRFIGGMMRDVAQNLVNAGRDALNAFRTEPGAGNVWSDTERADMQAPALGRAPQLPQVPAGPVERPLRNLAGYLLTFAATGGFRQGASLVQRVMGGAAADALQDPTDGSVVSLLRELGVGRETLQPVDAQAAAQADDMLRARLLSIAEGGVLGAGAEAVIAAVRAIRADPEMAQTMVRLLAASAAGAAMMPGDAQGAPRNVPFVSMPNARAAARQIDVPRALQVQPEFLQRLIGVPRSYTPRSPSFIPQSMDPDNAAVVSSRLQRIADRHPDPLASDADWLRMLAETYQSNIVPRQPSYLIRLANDIQAWVANHGRLTPEQIQAARRGLDTTLGYREAYQSGRATPLTTGRLALWGMLSRRMSAYPHEAAFLDLSDEANPFIERALQGRFTASPEALAAKFDEESGEMIGGTLQPGRSDLDDWLLMVRERMPADSPGRSATSNLNSFARDFLVKMSRPQPDGRTGLQHFHDLLSNWELSSIEIRRQFYGLGEGLGMSNKVLSFILLLTGRQDVVVLDRIQINQWFGDGRGVYESIARLFDGPQGLVVYEALERSMLQRLGQVYAGVGRSEFWETFGISGYHWESWVLNSGQVVEHPTIPVIREGADGSRTAGAVSEGRFYSRYFGTDYVVMPDGSRRFVSFTQAGEPRVFETMAELSTFMDSAFSRAAGIVPRTFPGVRALRGSDRPWYEWSSGNERINREALDTLLRSSGREPTAEERAFIRPRLGDGPVPPAGVGGPNADGAGTRRAGPDARQGVTDTPPGAPSSEGGAR